MGELRYEVLDEGPGTIVFRVRKGAWGIWVRLGAKALDIGEATVPLTPATGLVLSARAGARIGPDEVAELARGLRIALERSALAAPPRVIAVEELVFPGADYQPNGPAAAGYAWVAAAFGVELPPIAIRFDAAANAYEIGFPPA
ncbi:hypothetical protein [Glycomyces paridis]|uniref:Uncharacterized protein n=1 Tax=Glycomyces paridis TaxID=2126555 RepID=A0A4S8P2K7_9ACTN|nr:hypothetical protein [Glycomyces paridis]THV24313.1 hypothetical protein E9998_22075 [Glycomyces paridis]